MPTHRFSSPSSSSSCDEREVDAIIAQALDLVALEHIAALNTSHLPPSSPLPPHLSSRFRKLKSLPPSLPSVPPSQSPLSPQRSPPNPRCEPASPDRRPKPPPAVAEKASQSPPPPEISPPIRRREPASPDRRPKPRAAASPSPPRGRKGCCFGFSPRPGRKGEREGPWGRDGEDLLEELRGFSTREERRRMRKAMRELERASRESEKLMELSRQVSARIGDLAGATEMGQSDLDGEEEFK